MEPKGSRERRQEKQVRKHQTFGSPPQILFKTL